jgi:hypothetical protein
MIDKVISNNNDYPEHEVFIEPSDYQRKILYNRAFQQKWIEIEPFFIVRAVILDSTKPHFEEYNPRKLYDYFIIKKRK